jgi:hypothetical protein
MWISVWNIDLLLFRGFPWPSAIVPHLRPRCQPLLIVAARFFSAIVRAIHLK